jgi:hypothetical protein
VAGQDLKWWHVRWRLAARALSRFAVIGAKVVGSLGLVVAVVYGAIYLNSPWLTSQRLSKIDPRLNVIPMDLPTKAEAQLSNVVIDCRGFSVRLPNEEVAKTFNGDFDTAVIFRNRGSLLIHDMSGNQGMLGIAMSDKGAEKWVGQGVLQSKFKLMQAAMMTTPEQSKWWKFRTLQNERIEYLLFAKFSLFTGVASSQAVTLSPIYKISVGGLRGFQIGNPNVSPYEAHIDVFDAADRHFAIDVRGSARHGKVMTQAEINSVLASLRFTTQR